MKPTQNLILIETHSDIANALKQSVPNAVLASFNERIVEELDGHGVNTLWLGQFIHDKERLPLEKEGWELAGEWTSLAQVREAYLYNGIDLAASFRFELSLHLTWLLKLKTGLQRLFLERKFNAIYAVKSSPARPVLNSLNPCLDTHYCALITENLGYAVQAIAAAETPVIKKHFSLKDKLRPLGQKIYGWARQRNAAWHQTVLISGAYQQMRELMDEIQKDFSVLHLDRDFRFQKISFLWKRGIPNHSFDEEAPRATPNSGMPALPGPLGERWQRVTTPLLDYLWKQCVPSQRRAVDYFLHLLKSNTVRFVILDEDVTAFRHALVLCAKSLNIETLVISHYSAPSPAGYELYPASDHLAVGSEFLRKCLIEVGLPPEKLTVAGIPRYQNLLQGQTRFAAAEVGKSLGLPTGQRFVLFAFSLDFFQWYTRREWTGIRCALEDVLNAMESHPDKALVIKFHPLSDGSFLKSAGKVIKAHSFKNVRSVVNADTPSLIRAADAVVTFYSSVALEGALLKKPTVVLDYFPFEPITHWFFNEDKLLVRDKKALSAALNGVLEGDTTWVQRANAFNAQLSRTWLDSDKKNPCAYIRQFVLKNLESSRERVAVT